MTPWTTLLGGIVGSHAYGLNTPTSDVDRLQFAAAPTVAFHGLRLPVDKAATREHKSPDITVHEAGKAVSLLLKSNPTVSEVLWLGSYEILTPLGQELIDLRDRLLCAPRVRNAYLGYANQQFQRLINKGRFPDVPINRIAKHGRHLLRLVEQGTQLWTVEPCPRCEDIALHLLGEPHHFDSDGTAYPYRLIARTCRSCGHTWRERLDA